MLSLCRWSKSKMGNIGVLSVFVLLLIPLWSVSLATQIQLEVMHGWDGFREPMVNKMLDDFMKENPNIKVTTRLTAASNTVLNEQFSLAYAGGIAPDIVMLQTKSVLAQGTKGALLPLDEFLKKDGISPDIWVPSELASGQWEGVTYGLPIRSGGEDGNLLFYNRQIFAESGLNPEHPPATWDELLAYAKKLIRYDGNTIKMNPINDLTQSATIPPTLNWLYSGGGAYLSADMRKVVYNTPEAANAMDWVYNFRTVVYKNPNDDKMADADFYNGRSAMLFWGSQGFSYIWDQDPDFPLGVGPRPRKDGSTPYIGANVGTWTYAISAAAKNKEAAWVLLKWLTIREESAGWFIRMQGRPSPIRRYNRNSEYVKLNPFLSVLGTVLEQVAPIPILPVHDDVGIPLRDAFRKVIKGQAPARSALEQAAPVSQAVLDQFWKSYGK